MAIGNAVQRGMLVYVYDEKGHQTASINARGGSLAGYTSTAVNIKEGMLIYSYDEKGQPTGSTRA